MYLKQEKKHKNVRVFIDACKGNRFSDGKKSHSLTIYDANPDEVEVIIRDAIKSKEEN